MSDLAPHEQPLPVSIGAAEIGMRTGSLPPSLRILLDERMYDRVKAIAVLMSKATGMTPAHLIGKGEACFSIISMSLDWQLSPYFVARHTYQTPGGSIGYDGALVQSILEKSGRFMGAPSFEYRGDWSVLNGKFQMKQGQRGGEYPAATWTDADAIGLGVIVRWTVRGESTPRVWPGDNEPFWLAQCHPRNSPLWATDPKTQIRYLAIRRFANMCAPGILGGASFDQDDIIDASEMARDITPEPQREEYMEQPRGATIPLNEVEPEPEYNIVTIEGEVYGFEQPANAFDALANLLTDAQRREPPMVAQALENNDHLIGQLRQAGVPGLAQLLADYRPVPTPPAPPPPPPAPAPAPPPPAPAAAAAPAPDPPDPPPPAAVATANANAPPANSSAVEDHPGPTAAASPSEARTSRVIAPPFQRGRQDWRTWARALLVPKIRQQTDSNELADLLGDNEENLVQARASLDRQDAAELQAAIDAAWQRLRPAT